jgi:hypothetical protein
LSESSKLVRDGTVQWISSDALADEIDRNPDLERKSGNVALLALASEIIEENDQIAHRAKALQRAGAWLSNKSLARGRPSPIPHC